MAVLKVAAACLAAVLAGVVQVEAEVPAAAALPPARAHRAIATSVPAAQAAFDRGLLMLYAFNIGEARLAFRTAEAADPQAVLAYVGEAVAETIDINLPTTAEGERRGADAVTRGQKALSADTPADERELLAAAALRFERLKSGDARFTAYDRALTAYAKAHPADGMGRTWAAFAGWNATGRLIEGPADELTPAARFIADDLDAALTVDPDDVGAHHLRIHFWEEVHQPQRALADADYLAARQFAPGESHLEHMAGHIYDRVGNYTAMVRVNAGACANDAAYFALGDGDGQKYMRTYHAHDVDFVLYGLTTVGRFSDARSFAAGDSTYSREIVAVRTHDNRAVLTLFGDAITPLRVIAEARAGELDAARTDLAALSHGKTSTPAQTDNAIAAAVVARAAHDDGSAVDAYRRAQAAAGGELGDPKNRWWIPIGEGLGATLLEAREPVEAERVFRAELGRYPADPHLEFGLAEALAAQGQDDSAARAAYRAGWQGDKPLTLADLG